MIRVTALTAGKYDASSRFRIRQFIGPLAQHGVRVTEYWPLIDRYRIEPLPLLVMALRLPGLLASRFSEVAWLGRELASGKCTLEHLAGKKRLFDVDDAIWTPYPSDFSAAIAARCDGVIAGSAFLRDHYKNLCPRVWLVPMSVDTRVWRPAAKNPSASANSESTTGAGNTYSPRKKWTIGWLGTASNLKYLYAIEEPLADFLQRHEDARLLVCSGTRPSFHSLDASRWDFAPWSIEEEISNVQQMDVGLMPLEDSEAARGKCGFKMLAYMAVGIPVIVSPVGVNRERLAQGQIGLAATSPGDWYQALERLYQDRALAARMGATGRKVAEDHYSVEKNALLLADIFRQVAAE